MKKITVFLLCVVMLFGFCSCKKETADPRFADGSVVITAKNLPRLAVTELNVELALNLTTAVLGCEKQTAYGYITVCKTPDECYRLLSSGECDIVIAHEPSKTAVADFEEKGITVKSSCIAKDALTFTVCEQNEIQNLEIEQIKDVYSAKVTDWSALGGSEGEIKTFAAEKNTAAADAFEKLIRTDLTALQIPQRYVQTENGTYAATLDYDNGPNSVTFALYTDLQRLSSDKFGNRKMLSVASVYPEASAIQSGTYPLYLDILLTVNAAEPTDSVTSLYYNWILSEQGVKLIGSSGVILPIE